MMNVTSLELHSVWFDHGSIDVEFTLTLDGTEYEGVVYEDSDFIGIEWHGDSPDDVEFAEWVLRVAFCQSVSLTLTWDSATLPDVLVEARAHLDR